MNRRKFLINSTAAIGGSTLFLGCKKEKLIQKEDHVIKRKFKNAEVSLLGLGCMRLPMNNEEIDMVELDKMVEYLMNHGVNYFDPGFFYVNSRSEIAIGEVLKKYPRKNYFLADKLPISKIKCEQDIRKVFNKQLKKCQADYFDFYMAHNIKDNSYDTYKKYDIHQKLLKLKHEGKIKYVGFSFHGTADMLKKVVKEKNWDFCQIYINYFEWNIVVAKKQYEIIKNAGIPIVVVGPLGGGALINSPQKALDELKKNYPNTTPAEFGLRWAASLDNIVTVLSGMSNLEQVKQNVAVFENFKPITKKEKEFAKKIAKTIQSEGEIPCNACKQCLESCPQGINIPAIFATYNQYKVLDNKTMFTFYYETLSEKERAEKCIKCKLCDKICSQNINISEILEKINDEYKKIKANIKTA